MKVLAIRLSFLAAIAGCKPAGPVLVPAKETHAPQLDPERLAETAAARDGREGDVMIAYCIDTDGAAQDVKVVDAFDEEIATLAEQTVSAWRYEPATRDGVPYETCTDITFSVRWPKK